MHNDQQCIALQLLLCPPSIVVVKVDVRGCIGFIHRFKKGKNLVPFTQCLMNRTQTSIFNYFLKSVSSFDELFIWIINMLGGGGGGGDVVVKALPYKPAGPGFDSR